MNINSEETNVRLILSEKEKRKPAICIMNGGNPIILNVEQLLKRFPNIEKELKYRRNTPRRNEKIDERNYCLINQTRPSCMMVIGPSYDFATQLTEKSAKEAINYAKEKKIDTIGLLGDNAAKQEFEEAIDELNPRVISFYGHGNADRLIGQNGEVMIDKSNVNLLKGRIVQVVACLSAKELGPRAIEKGCVSYLGFTDYVWLPCETGIPFIDSKINALLLLRNSDAITLLGSAKATIS